jgi:hypothetical protein
MVLNHRKNAASRKKRQKLLEKKTKANISEPVADVKQPEPVSELSSIRL